MTVKRIINGENIEFKLTDEELLDAYLEREHEDDMETVSCLLDEDIPEPVLSAFANYCREQLNDSMEYTDCKTTIFADALYEARNKVEGVAETQLWLIEQKIKNRTPLTVEDYQTYNYICKTKEVMKDED